jgi:hypothetical protein
MENSITTPNGNGKSNRTSSIPDTDIDFGKVAADVAAKWTTTPSISLSWTTASEFSTQVTNYNTELSKRNHSGGNRPQITNKLKTLDAVMDESLAYVKGYILDKYKKESAASYYPSFGIQHKKTKYVFPIDRNKRSAALEQMIDALTANGLQDKEYGKTFWTDIKTQYDGLLDEATTSDGVTSNHVSNKNLLKTALTKTMNALIGTIKSNYPDTYKAELRIWGFQKEKY